MSFARRLYQDYFFFVRYYNFNHKTKIGAEFVCNQIQIMEFTWLGTPEQEYIDDNDY